MLASSENLSCGLVCFLLYLCRRLCGAQALHCLCFLSFRRRAPCFGPSHPHRKSRTAAHSLPSASSNHLPTNRISKAIRRMARFRPRGLGHVLQPQPPIHAIRRHVRDLHHRRQVAMHKERFGQDTRAALITFFGFQKILSSWPSRIRLCAFSSSSKTTRPISSVETASR